MWDIPPLVLPLMSQNLHTSPGIDVGHTSPGIASDVTELTNISTRKPLKHKM